MAPPSSSSAAQTLCADSESVLACGLVLKQHDHHHEHLKGHHHEFHGLMPGLGGARTGCGGLVKAHLSALVDRSPELKELLEEHGDPEDAHDQYKTILDIKTDMERDISIFAGAIQLLTDQHDDTEAGTCCSVCLREFESNADLRTALAELDAKIRATEVARDKSCVVERYHLCKIALETAQRSGGNFEDAMDTDDDDVERSSQNSSCVSGGSPRGPTEMVIVEGDSDAGSEDSGQPALDMCQRVAFNIRTGQLTELRNQKVENLQDQRCFACHRDFSGTGLAEYLRNVDRRAYAMSERLHHFVN
eukprot:CAMPEP_0171495846 /NCGR_PEP_ID=MMETSP0958-20121227/6366_1 /TAXON_ID=87120 /ORGANISM="Aurantiochytrium limacinum, Strain ATCCMYA-1381" /LENGTH=304 /DNA_ID=CAMNT_0012029869 /DNA_START=925 /DNA_END=1839 /DNA_ORIENTATION=-